MVQGHLKSLIPSPLWIEIEFHVAYLATETFPARIPGFFEDCKPLTAIGPGLLLCPELLKCASVAFLTTDERWFQTYFIPKCAFPIVDGHAPVSSAANGAGIHGPPPVARTTFVSM